MLLLKIAFRNILLHKLKTAIIGSIIVLGTVLAIAGNAVVDAISSGMRSSLINSVTGDIQIYSANAKEKLAIFGTMEGNMPDIGHVNDFKRIRDTLTARIPNIKSIIPMGGNFAAVNPGNILDIKLEELRALYRDRTAHQEKINSLKKHIHEILQDIETTFEQNVKNTNFFADNPDLKDAPENIQKALSPTFWRDFDTHAEERIEFLANKMAPLIFDDNMFFLSYIGTVPEKFKEEFPLFEIVKGTEIPKGKRGFLFNDYIYENMIKHRIARRLDQVKKEIVKNHDSIEKTKDLKDKITANIEQAAEIYTQMDPVQTERLIPKLQKLLSSKETKVKELLKNFLTMNDANFMERYQFFYENIAPYIVLYKVKVGDFFPITAYTKTGYASSLNMPVYGTFRFKSFESSPIAGNFNLMDMVSFRELYGFMTEERRKETQALEKEMGLSDVDRADIEKMFSGDVSSSSSRTKVERPSSADVQFSTEGSRARRNAMETIYSPEEMEDGVFLNAAVLLKNHSKLSETLRQIEEISKKEGLGIQAVDWREAAGIIGQLTSVVRALLFICVFVLFIVAAFIIMNSMLMTTMERSREIGTMRAIGAQRRFVLSVFLHEAFILSLIFGVIGSVIGVLIILIVGHIGIPATGDVATFFFSGPRLHLSVNGLHIILVVMAMTLLSILSTQYPAWRATKISPLRAMQKTD